MSGLEKIIAVMILFIIAINISTLTLKVARIDDKLSMIIDFEELNEVVAD